MEEVLPYLFLLVFPLMWIGISLLLSQLGGWARLAKHFPDDPDAVGTNYRFRSGAIGMANYGSCLSLRVCERGLRLSVLFLFRIGHPPLFIPWEQFHSLNEKRFLLFRTLYESQLRIALCHPKLIR
jgi:hypothetical protein